MRTWINHLSKSDRYLHKIAKQVVSHSCGLLIFMWAHSALQAADIQSVVAKDPNSGLPLLLQLTGTNGSRQFDRVTKTKTVENMLSNMDSEGIWTYTEHLLGQINVDEEQE
jgi:DNA polymerase phi